MPLILYVFEVLSCYVNEIAIEGEFWEFNLYTQRSSVCLLFEFKLKCIFNALYYFIVAISGVSIVTGCGLYDRGVAIRVPLGSRFFYFSAYCSCQWGPLSLLSKGYRGLLSLGLKQLGREANHSPLHLQIVSSSRKRRSTFYSLKSSLLN
jgi:hypothetical protein